MLKEEEVLVHVQKLQIKEKTAQRKLLVDLQVYAALQDNAHRKLNLMLGIIVLLDLSLFNSNDVDLPDIYQTQEIAQITLLVNLQMYAVRQGNAH